MDLIEQCIAQKVGRFLVYDDHRLLICTGDKAGTPFADVDSAPYRAESASATFGTRKMVNHLVPEALRAEYNLGFQKEFGYAVFTIFSAKPPSLEKLLKEINLPGADNHEK